MNGIFVMDENTYVHGIWSYGGPAFDCLGMLFKQKGEPWTCKWRFRHHTDSSPEGLNDEKNIYEAKGRDGSDEERDLLWEMQISASRHTADMMRKRLGIEVMVETIIVDGGYEETLKKLEEFKQMSIAMSYGLNDAPAGGGPIGEA
jgi:hypothetical protein